MSVVSPVLPLIGGGNTRFQPFMSKMLPMRLCWDWGQKNWLAFMN